VNAAIVGVKAALEGKDTAKIKAELEKLQNVMGEAGSAVYQETARQQARSQAGAPPGNDGDGSPRQETTGPGGEKVVDADFKVKED